MQVGFNFTLGATLGMVQRLIAEGRIDFCEVLIDNFLNVPPAELAGAFECPVAFHVMHSRFLETDLELLDSLAARLRVYIDALRPIYVSDHVLRFSHRNQQLRHLAEVDYREEYDDVRRRVEWWQDRLGRRLYLENYPSIMDGGFEAPAFYQRLTRETGAGVLFDASNAVVAHRNCGSPLEAWDDVIRQTEHFHVAGYHHSFIEPHITIDTHDRQLADDTLDYLRSRRAAFDRSRSATITYERDMEIEYESVAEDLDTLRALFSAPEPR